MIDSRAQIREFIIQNFLFGQPRGLTDQASFLENGFIDSTGVLELVAYLEQSFGIKVRDDEMIPDNLDSIDAIARYLERKRVTPDGKTAAHSGSPPAGRNPAPSSELTG